MLQWETFLGVYKKQDLSQAQQFLMAEHSIAWLCLWRKSADCREFEQMEEKSDEGAAEAASCALIAEA